MRALTSRERKSLRGIAHALEPSVHIGKQGVSEGALHQLDEQLVHHELIKVKFLAAKEQKKALGAIITERLHCELVGLVGHIAIFFRQNEKPEDRVVEFENLHAT
jgi:RNA-binding protein